MTKGGGDGRTLGGPDVNRPLSKADSSTCPACQRHKLISAPRRLAGTPLASCQWDETVTDAKEKVKLMILSKGQRYKGKKNCQQTQIKALQPHFFVQRELLSTVLQ